ncbi:hypothetical protein SCOR_07765 [Sulfidibacter corallicola]|uniref:Uncharacterized protein n=1 Tax=Sulfidibacter corallicola TaxID=2818388 RepID=A0A8A4TP65_SULCO|nr:hypothetical protein [Sulfidibacter corallicola]QTD51340.1 hypothetical protein J3U87_02630 [Sulfidibacter corallicola]
MNDPIPAIINRIYAQTMEKSGFLWKLRIGEVDEKGFQMFIGAIEDLTSHYRERETISKLVVACLFEVPWEIENTVDHFKKKDEASGKQVSNMACRAREAIQNMLWEGLEEYYKDV